MQKVVTVTIDIDKLQQTAKGQFAVTEVEEINDMLEEGWTIEEWDFITGEKEDEKAVMIFILNDGLDDMEFERSFYNMEDEDAEEEESGEEHEERISSAH
jgi:hypothetical protein